MASQARKLKLLRKYASVKGVISPLGQDFLRLTSQTPFEKFSALELQRLDQEWIDAEAAIEAAEDAEASAPVPTPEAPVAPQAEAPAAPSEPAPAEVSPVADSPAPVESGASESTDGGSENPAASSDAKDE